MSDLSSFLSNVMSAPAIDIYLLTLGIESCIFRHTIFATDFPVEVQKETYLAFVLDKVEESIVAQANQISALSEERDRLDMALQVKPSATLLSCHLEL